MAESLISLEHRGLAKVHMICAELDSIWRPTIHNDLGVDGQIELLEETSVISTGKIIAVQVKSGSSYFQYENEQSVKFYPKKKHRKYWQRLIIPVILVLHDSKRNLTIYTSVKPQLINDGPIIIHKSSVFNASARGDLLKLYDRESIIIDPGDVLQSFKSVLLWVGETKITGLEFLLAVVKRNDNYMELRMARINAMFNYIKDSECLSFNNDTYDYILRCVMKLWTFQLVEPFESEFDHYWYDLHMVPDIASPLTDFGSRVIDFLWVNIEDYINDKDVSSIYYANNIARIALIASDRLDYSDKLGDVPR